MKRTRVSTAWLIVTLLVASGLGRPLRGETLAKPADDDLKARVTALEESVEKLEAELQILQAHNQRLIQRTHVGYDNATYLGLVLSLLLPRQSTFSVGTDSGLGVGAGVGHYFGRHHVVEGSVVWDFYVALDLQYRYELRSSTSGLSAGPVVGYRTKLFALSPFDKFIVDPARARHTYYYFGGLVTLPTSGASVLRAELLYMRNVQQVFVAKVGMHFFL
jgi:hypothetical protein